MGLEYVQTHIFLKYYLLNFLRSINAASSDANPKNAVVVVVIPVFANDFFTFVVVLLDSLVLTGVATNVSLTSDCPKISLISGFLSDVGVDSPTNPFCSLI